jgi:hypothetical protein
VRNTPVYDRLRALGVSDRLARQWISEHGVAHVDEKLAYVQGRDDVQNPARYLQATIKGQVKAPEVPTSDRARKLTIVRDLVAARSPTQRDADRRIFLARISDGAARQDFETHGWMSALNAIAILAFWEDVAPDAFA